METKKMTKKEAFTEMLELVKGAEREVELIAILEKEIELLSKKRATLTKTQKENAEKVELIYDVMAELTEAKTIADLFKLEDIQAIEGITSTQKLQALVKKLVDAGRVVRTEDKRKAYFSVAQD